MQRQQCMFSGRVQGVGFRYTVKNIALRYDVGGYVKNLPDGRVELVMEGPEDQMEHLLDDVEQRMQQYIQQMEKKTSPATGEFAHFSIKH